MSDEIKYRLKQLPTDVWSVREKLALASSVMRSGDQNWVSVSRAIKPFGNPGRPDDWFSQKNCALQYSALLEKVETPRRKRGERDIADTPGDVIVRKLTVERIEELKHIIQEEKAKYRNLKQDLELVKSGQKDRQVKEMWDKLQAEKLAAEEEATKKAVDEKAARDVAKALAVRQKKPTFTKKLPIASTSDYDDSTQDSVVDSFANDDSNQLLNTPGTSHPNESLTMTPLLPDLSVPLSNNSKSMEGELNRSVVDVDNDSSFAIKEELMEVTVDSTQQLTAEADADDTDTKATSADVGSVLFSAADASVTTKNDDDDDDDDDDDVTVTDNLSSTNANHPSDDTGVIVQMAYINKSESDVGATGRPEEIKLIIKSPTRRSNAVDNKEITSSQQKHDAAHIEHQRKSVSSSVDEIDDVASSPASSVASTDVAASASRHSSRAEQRSRRSQRKSSRSRPSEEKEREMEEIGSKPNENETSDDDTASRTIHDDSNASDVLNSSTVRQKLDLTESLPNSPASFTHETEDEKAHKVWKKSIMLVYRSAATHKFANVFMHKVNEDIAPGYHSIVHRPMDLSTIKKNIDSGVIRTTAEFQHDMMLMLINAMMYNNVEHDVHKMAREMYGDVMTHIEHFVNTQMMVQVEPKILRTLRRSDAHSDKEEDQRKRKISEQEGQTTSTTGSSVKKRR